MSFDAIMEPNHAGTHTLIHARTHGRIRAFAGSETRGGGGEAAAGRGLAPQARGRDAGYAGEDAEARCRQCTLQARCSMLRVSMSQCLVLAHTFHSEAHACTFSGIHGR